MAQGCCALPDECHLEQPSPRRNIASAADKVSPEKADRDLVGDAAASPVDLFSKRSREWVSRNQDPDDGMEEVARQRRDRGWSHWSSDTGMWMFLAELDSITGPRVKARHDASVDALWRDDDGSETHPNGVRTAAQRGADAFAGFCLADPPASETKTAAPAPSPKHQLNVVADLQRLSDDPDGMAQLVTDGSPLLQAVLELKRIRCNRHHQSGAGLHSLPSRHP
jgi:hypothetical protein